MSIARAALAGLVGYGAGHLQSAELVARKIDATTDIRKQGTGNPGAANVADLLGKRAGAAVFGLDMGKAVVAGQIGRVLSGATGANVAAAAAVLGHCYPAFPASKRFRGGKGVAASFGQMLVTFPAYLPVDIALGAIAAKSAFWKQRPVATISATCGLWVGLATVATRRGLPNLWGPDPTTAMPLAAAAASAAIVHRFAVESRTS